MAKHRKPAQHEDAGGRPKDRERERRNDERDRAHTGERESSQPEPGKAPGLAGDVVGR